MNRAANPVGNALPVTFASAFIAFRSLAVTRTRSITSLAFPFGRVGRPTFLGLGVGIASELLNNEGPYEDVAGFYLSLVRKRMCLAGPK